MANKRATRKRTIRVKDLPVTNTGKDAKGGETTTDKTGVAILRFPK